MPEWLTPSAIGALTPAGLLSLGVLLLMTGRIRPARAVEEVRQDRDARLADARDQIEIWRDAYRLSEVAREKSETALRESLETNRITVDLLRSVRSAQESA